MKSNNIENNIENNIAKNAKNIIATAIIAGIMPLFFSGCQIFGSVSSVSESVGSLSTSVESISTSLGSLSGSLKSSSDSSGSSSGDDKKSKKTEAYRRDVRDFLVLFVRSGSSHQDPQIRSKEFLRGLSLIAARRGIIHWERESATYIGMGEGLKTAGADQQTLQRIEAGIIKGNPKLIKLIRRGFHS